MSSELPIKVNAIIYKEVEDVPSFLLLKRVEQDGGFWQSVTGTVVDNESIVDTLVRELNEETGITKGDIVNISDLIYSFTWNRNDVCIQEFVYVVKVKEIKVTLNPSEHDEYVWSSFEDVLLLLKYDSNIVSFIKGLKYIKGSS